MLRYYKQRATRFWESAASAAEVCLRPVGAGFRTRLKPRAPRLKLRAARETRFWESAASAAEVCLRPVGAGFRTRLKPRAPWLKLRAARETRFWESAASAAAASVIVFGIEFAKVRVGIELSHQMLPAMRGH